MSNVNEQLIKLSPNALAIFGDAAKNTKFSAGISGGEFLPKISIKGREFALVIGGERKRLPNRTMNVVIVDARASVSKEFYENAWGSGVEAKAPECSSADGLTPDVGVTKPQSATCQLCPHNAWKSGTNGKGKRCGDHKVLIVVPESKLDAQPFQLRVPAASLKAFGSYVRTLDTHGIPVNGAVTQLAFADTEYPQLEFAFVDVIKSQADFALVVAAAERPDVKDVLRGIVVKPADAHASTPPVTIQRETVAPPAPVVAVVEPALAGWETPAPTATAAPASGPVVDVEIADAGKASEIDDVINGWMTGAGSK